MKRKGESETKNNLTGGFFSIRNKLIIGFSIPIVFMIVIGVAAYQKAAAGMSEKYEVSTLQTVSMITEYINMSDTYIEADASRYAYDTNLGKYAMRNVSRPLYMILNNRFRPDDLGSSIELKEMPQIGSLSNLIFSNIIARDDSEMQNPHRRFGNDLMGAPFFNGIRMDACEKHPIENVMINQLIYQTIGGVHLDELPTEYPRVIDQLKQPGMMGSENYYPDWSRTAFLDIRNVNGLHLSNVELQAIHADERPPYLLEGCSTYKEEVHVREPKEE